MSKLTVTPGLGLPAWTEIGQIAGLDPLGMARPTEAVYQSLLPGISTITNRLRYYSFFPWLLDSYARKYGDTDPATFFRFQRRSEGLFALIGVSGVNDIGLTGANWALNLLAQSGDTIEFGATAELTDGKGYLKNKGGALGAIYGPQLREMDLVGSSTGHSLPVPTARGDRASMALKSSIGEPESVFLDAVGAGKISRSDLQSLSALKPSGIEPGSPEQDLLSSLLLGALEDASAIDLARRQTMIKILRYAEQTGAMPTALDLRWAWFDRATFDLDDDVRVLDPWAAYQCNDLLRMAYETFLKRAVEILAASPANTYRLTTLAAEILEDVQDEYLQGTFVRNLVDQASVRNLSAAMERTGDPVVPVSDEALGAAVLIIRSMLSWADRNQNEVAAIFPLTSAFQSVSSELKFVRELQADSARETLGAIIQDRILKRHLWVASRKFSGQFAYTFLFEPEDGYLRYRGLPVVAPSSPRLSQAIQFLFDARLLEKEKGISEHGLKALQVA
jgi:hypothetical protein